MTTPIQSIILIDDDNDCNLLTKFAIHKAEILVEIHIFNFAEEALEFIQINYSNNLYDHPTTILLDINMGTMSGWEFMEAFSLLSGKIKKQFQIFFLSSSVDEHDKSRALSIPLIAGYLEKPLSQETLIKISKVEPKDGDRYHTDPSRK
ncbi:MAG: response regulator [Bacteroidetes bacterium]|nr:response regulator [Bacteroidota bacterium]MBK9525603.1 response regulator [Bacteroidota bacterium]